MTPRQTMDIWWRYVRVRDALELRDAQKLRAVDFEVEHYKKYERGLAPTTLEIDNRDGRKSMTGRNRKARVLTAAELED